MSVALFMQHAKRVRRIILSSGFSGFATFFSLSPKRLNFFLEGRGWGEY
jgi:hypothetical protein